MFQAVASSFSANPTFLVRFVRHFGVHILVFMVASVVGIILAFFFLGSFFRIFDKRGLKDPVFGIISCMIFYVCISGPNGVYACLWALVSCLGQGSFFSKKGSNSLDLRVQLWWSGKCAFCHVTHFVCPGFNPQVP